MNTIRLAGKFRKLVNGLEEINLNDVNSIFECINRLEDLYPGVKAAICDESGEVLKIIDIFVNGDNIRSLEGLSSRLKDGDEIDIISAFAGG